MIPSLTDEERKNIYNPRTPLRDAIDTGDVKKVRAALKKFGLGGADGHLGFAMMDAVDAWRKGRPAILKALIEAGVCEPATDRCVVGAVEDGDVELMRVLLEAGVSEEGRGVGLVRASEWMRDIEIWPKPVSPVAHEAIVRMLLAAGTKKDARERAMVKAAAYGDAWMVWMLLNAGVGSKAITEAIEQAEKYEEKAVLAVLTARGTGGVNAPPIRRAAVFDIYFVADGAAHAALLEPVVRAYAAAWQKQPDAEQMIADARVAGERIAASQMLDVAVGDGVAAGEIEKRWMSLGGGGNVVLLGARSRWETSEAGAWRDAIATGEWRSLIAG